MGVEERTQKRTKTHVCDLIERETARRIIDSPRSREQMLRMLEATPPAQPDHIAEVGKKVDADLISRHDVYTFLDEMRYPLLANLIMNEECIPSAQPKIIICKDCKYYKNDDLQNKSSKWLPCMDIATGSYWFCGSAERREE